ncbi:MAG TPA: DUF72 domain-containing protein [Acidimicrobiales bacterium]|nr:DUF72 domain-containing protein [Acidimicrobiales bacterium]
MAVWVGCSGWQYTSWRGPFYPPGLPQARWLEHYAAAFATVEVNNTFYRLPPPETFETWARRTPDDFLVTIKASRYLTHVKRLRDPEEPVGRLMEGATRLGAKLGPVLLQFPPDMKAAPEALDRALAAFPAGVRLAVEPRHRSWFSAETRAVLEARGAALCLADRMSRPITPLWATADWGYVRFHEGRGALRPCYGRSALRSWAERIAELWPADADVYAYFNNDPRGCAVHDTRVFARLVADRGLVPTRVPETPVHPALV